MRINQFINLNQSPSFALPDISEEERIRVPCQKTKKHSTKRRGNKLHDKKR